MASSEQFSLDIQKATLADAAEIAEILQDGKRIKQELHQDKIWEWREFTQEWVENSMREEGDFFVGRRSNAMAELAFQITWSDELIWGEQPPIAGHVHKLSRRRISEAHHQGLGTQALNWAGRYIARNGRQLMRIDVPQSNEPLQRYYTNTQGFQWVRDKVVPIPGKPEPYYASLFERPVILGD